MNPLDRALLEKAGNDHGFEHVLPAEAAAVSLASARHRAQVRIVRGTNGTWILTIAAALSRRLLCAELARSFPDSVAADGSLVTRNIAELAKLLRRTAELAHSLPNQAQSDFETEIALELAKLSADGIRATEVERVVRQRVGQQTFRLAMLEYWDGACAVTGIAVPAVLRASHAKPWTACASDAARLDVFNGFLLSANLDALFDRFLISFDDTGKLLISRAIEPSEREALGLHKPLRLRWLACEHLPYLDYHRARFQEAVKPEL